MKSRMDLGGGDMDWLRGRAHLKPEDQLQLTEAELQEEFARVLTIHNTRVPDSLVEWSWKLKEFIILPPPPHLITLLSVPGLLLHKDSEEAKIQLAGGLIVEGHLEEPIEGDEEEEEEEEGEEEEEEEEAEDEEKLEEPTKAKPEPEREHEHEAEPDEEEERVKPKKIPNQFNFCERAALTYTNPMREMSTQTVPPPTATFNTHVFQWTIFDEYQAYYAQQQREREKERRLPFLQPKREELKKKSQTETMAVTCRMLLAAKALERMVNQNIFDEIAQDYRYWDDPSDEFKDGEGSLLPLWKFSYEKTKKHDVTDLCFNSRYYDLFAVAYGTMSFSSLITTGTVCLFSLKNPSYPEWICPTESPVMCLDFSEQHPHLLVIGTMDGVVAVYNVMLPPTTPQYKSNDIVQKHGGIVWEVCWAPDTEEGNLAFYSVSIDGKINHWVLNQNDLGLTTVMTLFLDRPPIPGPDGTMIYVCWAPDTEEGNLAFYSVSIDGKINHWVLNQNDLGLTTVMTLFLDRPPIPGPDGTMITLKGCGTCFAFHPSDENVFLVGTEEGTIYKCNTAYSSVYMRTYNEAHNMPVYRIVFNKFNSNIFASCSGDWRIKIWEDNRMEPLFMFDLGVPIGDVQWAPYSSTVLACVSNDGKVTVFDLNINKYRPICSQQVVSKKKNKLTRLAFNNKLPFIIVGDDKGTINTLKLSPNLRIKVKPTKKQIHLTHNELETMKLERLLSFVREPCVLPPPKDTRAVT
ncbi:Dynein intermediate chain 1, axonemal [Habropoda laboriosa]|uniref:Dynein intermediate chain 1, axonemal n=1 Tax=Habropoda laboriosa TaxID=597456 RepID=A0A0L7R070_9HYME|nr:Dynein intermediate chain 1, axonemal [Habropoda laboriosa]